MRDIYFTLFKETSPSISIFVLFDADQGVSERCVLEVAALGNDEGGNDLKAEIRDAYGEDLCGDTSSLLELAEGYKKWWFLARPDKLESYDAAEADNNNSLRRDLGLSLPFSSEWGEMAQEGGFQVGSQCTLYPQPMSLCIYCAFIVGLAVHCS